jgi:hypothetical protein
MDRLTLIYKRYAQDADGSLEYDCIAQAKFHCTSFLGSAIISLLYWKKPSGITKHLEKCICKDKWHEKYSQMFWGWYLRWCIAYFRFKGTQTCWQHMNNPIDCHVQFLVTIGVVSRHRIQTNSHHVKGLTLEH